MNCQQRRWPRATLLNVNKTVCLSLQPVKPMCEKSLPLYTAKGHLVNVAPRLRLLIRRVKTSCVLQHAARGERGERRPEYSPAVGGPQDKFKINGLPMSRKFTRPGIIWVGALASQVGLNI